MLMIYIKSKADKILVLKSIDALPLRIFPGANAVPIENVGMFEDLYLTSEAAKGMMAEYCKIVEKSTVSLKAANETIKKNERLNKAYVLMRERTKLRSKTMEKDSGYVEKLEKQIDALNKRIDAILANQRTEGKEPEKEPEKKKKGTV
jgi:hypothetical protein